MLVIGWRSETPDGRLDPRLNLLVDLAHLAATCCNRWADHDPHSTGFLHETAPRPVVAGVVRDRNEQPPGRRGEQCAAYTVPAGLADRHTRALGVAHPPVAFLEPRLALLDHLRHRRVPGAPIDGDGMHLPHPEPHHWDP